MPLINKLKNRLERFGKKSDGTVSVEFVIWTPIFLFLMVAAIDASLLFMTQSQYWSVSRDTARLVARHAMTPTEAEAYAVQRAGAYFGSPEASVSINGQAVRVHLRASANSVMIFDGFGFTDDLEIQAALIQSLEPI